MGCQVANRQSIHGWNLCDHTGVPELKARGTKKGDRKKWEKWQKEKKEKTERKETHGKENSTHELAIHKLARFNKRSHLGKVYSTWIPSHRSAPLGKKKTGSGVAI